MRARIKSPIGRGLEYLVAGAAVAFPIILGGGAIRYATEGDWLLAAILAVLAFFAVGLTKEVLQVAKARLFGPIEKQR